MEAMEAIDPLTNETTTITMTIDPIRTIVALFAQMISLQDPMETVSVNESLTIKMTREIQREDAHHQLLGINLDDVVENVVQIDQAMEIEPINNHLIVVQIDAVQ
jgi:hypothetical protein